MDYLVEMQKKFPYLKDEEIKICYEIAKEILLNTLYPFDEDRDERPTRNTMWVYRCMVEIIERNGMSSALSYKENGYSITFDRTQVSQGLMNELIPESMCL